MKSTFNSSIRCLSLLGAAMVVVAPALVWAQAAPASGDQAAPADKSAADKGSSEIVVTGTLIRGVKAAGSESISVDAASITELGAVSTNALISSIPQFGNFNDRPTNDPRANALESIDRINLRNLPGWNSGSGSVTLTLVDGHRITPVGVSESAIDVDIIPSAVLERVDVVTDGGSSLYGADAVSGVVNFVTMKKFDGVKIDANSGFGTTLTSYHQADVSVTVGKSWSTGNAYISGGYDTHSNVTNGDTSWAKSGGWSGNTFIPNGSQCLSPVGKTDTYDYIPSYNVWTDNPFAPGAGIKNVGNPCDQFAQQSYYPKTTRYNFFGSLSQQLASNVDLRVTGYYTNKKTTFSDYPIGMTTSAQPAPTGNPGVFTQVTVDAGTGFSFGSNPAYIQKSSFNQFSTWGITPEIKADFGRWQVRATLDYGESNNKQRLPAVNTALAQADINAGVFTPATVASLNAGELNNILNWENAQDTNHRQLDSKVVADGPLIKLPGGDAKLAIGAEYQHNTAESRTNTGTVGSVSSVPYASASQSAESVFGELSAPVLPMLELSASLRYDHYSDFGNTTNPTLGARFKPTSWLSIYGHWGKSFNAPTAMDKLAISTAAYLPAATCSVSVPCANYETTPTSYVTTGSPILLTGATKGLQPQTATSWALGFDAKPTSRFSFGVEYYNIDFRNVLGKINPANPQVFEVTNPQDFIFPAAGQASIAPSVVQYYVNQTSNAAQALAQIGTNPISEIVDYRTTNVANAKVTGLDFHANLVVPAGEGNLMFGLNGNKELVSNEILGGASTDLLQSGLVGSGPTLTASANVGWSLHRFTSRVTVNYDDAYTTQDYTGASVKVNPFVVTNLFLSYDFSGSGPLSNMSLRFSVDNVFNRTPRIVEESSTGSLSYRGWTLGRVLKIGATEKF